jgi:hypothetical protein
MASAKSKFTELEARRRAFYKMVEAADSEPMELIRASLKATTAGEERIDGASARERESYRNQEAEYCLENRNDVAKIYENPLDDDERLEEVRRMIFGCAPQQNYNP